MDTMARLAIIAMVAALFAVIALPSVIVTASNSEAIPGIASHGIDCDSMKIQSVEALYREFDNPLSARFAPIVTGDEDAGVHPDHEVCVTVRRHICRTIQIPPWGPTRICYWVEETTCYPTGG